MPIDFDAPEYALEGGDGESLPFVGSPVDAFFQDGRFGTELSIRFQRSLEHQTLYPNAKAEIGWTWRTGPDWTVEDNGASIAHPKADKAINANTDLGKMFGALKKVEGVGALLPDGWSPTNAKSWKALPEMEWYWHETPARMPDPSDPTGKKYIVNPDPEAKPKRLMLPLKLAGVGTSNGQVPEAFDLSTLAIPDELLPLMQEAAKTAGNADQLLANFAKVPGALQHPGIMQVLSDKPKAEAFRVSLGGSF